MSNQMARSKRLPNGETTRDRIEYVDAWRGEAAAIVAATGWSVAAYDPGVVFEDLRSTFCSRCYMPMQMVRTLTAALLKGSK